MTGRLSKCSSPFLWYLWYAPRNRAQSGHRNLPSQSFNWMAPPSDAPMEILYPHHQWILSVHHKYLSDSEPPISPTGNQNVSRQPSALDTLGPCSHACNWSLHFQAPLSYLILRPLDPADPSRITRGMAQQSVQALLWPNGTSELAVDLPKEHGVRSPQTAPGRRGRFRGRSGPGGVRRWTRQR